MTNQKEFYKYLNYQNHVLYQYILSYETYIDYKLSTFTSWIHNKNNYKHKHIIYRIWKCKEEGACQNRPLSIKIYVEVIFRDMTFPVETVLLSIKILHIIIFYMWYNHQNDIIHEMKNLCKIILNYIKHKNI